MSDFLPQKTQVFYPAGCDIGTFQSGPRPPIAVDALSANAWPRCDWLLSASDSADWIAYAPCGNPTSLQIIQSELLPKIAAVWSGQHTVILNAVSPLPEALENTLQPLLVPFVYRTSAWELLVLPREFLANAGKLPLSDLVLQNNPILKSARRGLATQHLPALTASQPSLDENAFSRAIRRLFQNFRTLSAHRSCLEAGLLLLHDFDDSCHSLVQSLEGRGALQSADYWHGIMHRREPDAANASWWFRKAQNHPSLKILGVNLRTWLEELHVPPEILSCADNFTGHRWAFDPIRLTNLANSALDDRSGFAAQTAQILQYWEAVSLLTFGD